jgi:hypothetical protein
MHEYYINYCTSAKVFLDPGVTILMHSEIKLHRELGKEFNFLFSFKKIPVALGSLIFNLKMCRTIISHSC